MNFEYIYYFNQEVETYFHLSISSIVPIFVLRVIINLNCFDLFVLDSLKIIRIVNPYKLPMSNIQFESNLI